MYSQDINLNDWNLFRPIVDYLIEKNLPVPKDLNHLEPRIYKDALKHVENIDKEINYLLENRRKIA